MERCISIFLDEFLPYVKRNIVDNGISFGNMEFDYVLEKINGCWLLFVYDVAVDHYGMPYRNMFEYRVFNVDNFMI